MPDRLSIFTRAGPIRLGRCADCGCHPVQGHKDECPNQGDSQ